MKTNFHQFSKVLDHLFLSTRVWEWGKNMPFLPHLCHVCFKILIKCGQNTEKDILISIWSPNVQQLKKYLKEIASCFWNYLLDFWDCCWKILDCSGNLDCSGCSGLFQSEYKPIWKLDTASAQNSEKIIL